MELEMFSERAIQLQKILRQYFKDYVMAIDRIVQDNLHEILEKLHLCGKDIYLNIW